MNITIRPASTIEDCLHAEQIMYHAWEGDDTVVPDHLLITLAENSGCVLLAWDGDKPVGFCFGFLTFIGRNATDPQLTLKHHSHQAGVLPAYKGRGIGTQLKWAQRDFVLNQHITHMTWTFDPLEMLNGHFNLYKLGTVCNTYKRNVYGVGRDPLSFGMLTDRFETDWWLASDHVAAHQAGSYTHQSAAQWLANGAALLNAVDSAENHPRPQSHTLSLLDQHEYILITIPSDFQALKKDDLELAKAWRLHTRTLFEAAFAANFVVIDAMREPTQSYYLLQKNWTP